MQSVFDPIFAQILSLVRKQIQAVEESDKARMKVRSCGIEVNGEILFLVGGLGSNRYLGEFLRDKLKGTIDVKQPMAGYLSLRAC